MRLRVSPESLVSFIEAMRGYGFSIGVGDVVDTVRAVGAPVHIDSEDLREILRILLVKNPEQYELYDTLFAWFWLGGDRPPLAVREKALVRVLGDINAADVFKSFISIYSPSDIRGRAPQELRVDFSAKALVRRSLKILSRKMPTQPGKRRRRSSKGELDFPESFREALSTAGELVKLRRARRKLAKTHLVLLIDISGSMEEFWPRILRILSGIKAMPQSSYEIFVFSTEVERITDLVSSSSFEKLAEEILAGIDFWGSGTRIGEALGKIVTRHGSYIKRGSTVIVISDGWDLGDLDTLDRNLSQLAKMASRLIWISPYASRPGYSPETACLKIALKHVKKILPLEVLENSRTALKFHRGAAGPP